MNKQLLLSALLLGKCFFALPSARAADFLMSGAGARSVAMGGVYAPASNNVLDAMAINPAGLALIAAPWIDLTLTGGLALGEYTRTGTATAHLNTAGAIPYGAFGMPVGRRFGIGVAVLPELLSTARWDYSDPLGGVGSVSYGRLRSASSIAAIRTALGAGFSLGSRIQVGATLNSTYNSNQLNTAYVFQTYQRLAGLKTLLTLRTSGTGWSGAGGVLIRTSRTTRLSASYRSRTSIRSKGEAAGNAGVQFTAIGLGSARPDFRYAAEVDNVLPQSATFGVIWQATTKLQIAAQADWIGWRTAFRKLPVILTNGNNADINGLLGTDKFTDFIPLDWHDQVVARIGVARKWRERGTLRAGYAHANTPVPGSTLSPLTGAIMRHTLSAGAGYSAGRWLFEAAYSLDPPVTQSSGRSAWKSGEYDNARLRVATHSIVLTTSFRVR